jgi:hypothetical protein
MNSFYRYLIKATACLGLWMMIFPILGMGYDSTSAKSASNADFEQPIQGGGKVIMMKLATDTPKKQFQLSENTLTQQPPSKIKQLQRTSNKQTQQSSASAKTHLRNSGSKRTKQPVAKNQPSDLTVPTNASPQPDAEHIAEPPEIHEAIFTEPIMPVDPAPLLTETHPPTFNTDDVSTVSKKNDDITTASIKLSPEYTPQQDSIRDNVAIIARLLFKFSLITVCCIALFFSFSALQITKSNQRIQYQVGVETGTK